MTDLQLTNKMVEELWVERDCLRARVKALEEGLRGTLSAMEAMAAGEAARDAPGDLARLWNTAAYHARALLARRGARP